MKTFDIAKRLERPMIGNPDLEIDSPAELDQAAENQLSFLEADKYLPKGKISKAGCIIAPPGTSLEGKTLIHSPEPRYDFIRAVELLLPVCRPTPGIDPTAVIDASARIAPDAFLGPYVVVEAGAEIGAEAWIEAHCFIGRDCRIGRCSHLHPQVVLYPNVKIGGDCILHSGTVIGADGFGYMPYHGNHLKFPQRGQVEIEDEVEIGANVCIDRASLGSTRIGKGTKIDNLVQIAHNVQVGPHCLIVSLTGISGSSVLEDHVTLAGQVGVGEHAHICRNAIVGGQAGVLNGKNLRGGILYWGTPARPMPTILEQHRLLASIPGLKREIEKIKEQLALLREMVKN